MTLFEGTLTLERPQRLTLLPGQGATVENGSTAALVRTLSPDELAERAAWRMRFRFQGWCSAPDGVRQSWLGDCPGRFSFAQPRAAVPHFQVSPFLPFGTMGPSYPSPGRGTPSQGQFPNSASHWAILATLISAHLAAAHLFDRMRQSNTHRGPCGARQPNGTGHDQRADQAQSAGRGRSRRVAAAAGPPRTRRRTDSDRLGRAAVAARRLRRRHQHEERRRDRGGRDQRAGRHARAARSRSSTPTRAACRPRAAPRAERLMQQNKVVAVFGEFHSPVALAEMEVYHKYGIPFMACDVWSDQITAKGYPEVFRNAPAVSLIDVDHRPMDRRRRLQERRHHRREGRRRAWPRARWSQQELDQGRRQIHRGRCRSEPDRLHRADPALQEHVAAVRFLPQLLCRGRRLSDDPPGARSRLRADASVRHLQFRRRGGGSDLLGECRRGRQVSGHRECRPAEGGWNDKTKAFVAAYKPKHNADPSGAVMESYDGAWLLFDAIRTAGSTEPKAIISALEKTNYVGVRGKYAFSTDHEPAWHYHQFLDAPLTILQYPRSSRASRKRRSSGRASSPRCRTPTRSRGPEGITALSAHAPAGCHREQLSLRAKRSNLVRPWARDSFAALAMTGHGAQG